MAANFADAIKVGTFQCDRRIDFKIFGQSIDVRNIIGAAQESVLIGHLTVPNQKHVFSRNVKNAPKAS